MLPGPPLRTLFRSRWAALAWAVGICVGAANFVGSPDPASVDAANSDGSILAQANALLAEDPD